jgi:hypothetical protein
LLAVAVALLVTTPGRASAASPQEIDVMVVAPGEELGHLAQRLRDVLVVGDSPAGPGGVVRMGHADRFEPQDLFRLEGPATDHPAAWVEMDGAVVHLRAAGPGRERFVFRDLAVSRPLNELDRERIAQALKAALATVIEGGPSALGRSEAQRRVANEPAAPVPPMPVASAPEAAPRESWVRGGLGGFFQGMSLHTSTYFGVGIIGSLELTAFSIRPSVWASLMTFLPHGLSPSEQAAGYGSAFHGGVGVRLAEIPWMELDLGFGFEWARPATLGGGSDRLAVYRIAERLGPVAVMDVKVALAIFFELATESFSNGFLGPPGSTRPGAALELWWN